MTVWQLLNRLPSIHCAFAHFLTIRLTEFTKFLFQFGLILLKPNFTVDSEFLAWLCCRNFSFRQLGTSEVLLCCLVGVI